MNAEFEGFLRGLPSHFELKDRATYGKEDLNSVRVTMPVSVDEISEIVSGHGFSVVGLLDRSGYEVVYGWDPGDAAFKAFISQVYTSPHRNIAFKDLGDGCVETCLWDAHVFRRALVGNPPVSSQDVARFYERELVERESYPFVVLADGVPFGDFIETYPRIKREHDGDNEEWDFDEGYSGVILRPDFYFKLERYMRRKGWLHETAGISPYASFHLKSGTLQIFGVDEWDVGGFWFEFGGNLEKNPGVLAVYERKKVEEIESVDRGLEGAVG